MPRQPFLPTFQNVSYGVGAFTLKTRPHLATAIGNIVGTWSWVDNEMGNLFGLLLGTDNEAAREVFLSLRRTSSQLDAMQAAATHRLQEPDEMMVFRWLLKRYQSLEKERTALAHGCFGVCDDDHDLLLWIETKHHVEFQATVLAPDFQHSSDVDSHALLKQHMFVYRLQDLEELHARMEEFYMDIFHFLAYLRRPGLTGRREEFRALVGKAEAET